MNVGQLQLSSGSFATNSRSNQHLTSPFEAGVHIFKRQGACIKGKALVGLLWQKSNCSMSDRYITPNFCYKPVRYVTKTWSVVLLNKKYTYSYLKCIVYEKLLKPRHLFCITLYFQFICTEMTSIRHT
jgi:hypothetical protein